MDWFGFGPCDRIYKDCCCCGVDVWGGGGKVNWGIGMIAMPFYLHSAGLVMGLFFFVLSMLLALDAAVVMHKLSERLQEV